MLNADTNPEVRPSLLKIFTNAPTKMSDEARALLFEVLEKIESAAQCRRPTAEIHWHSGSSDERWETTLSPAWKEVWVHLSRNGLAPHWVFPISRDAWGGSDTYRIHARVPGPSSDPVEFLGAPFRGIRVFFGKFW